MTVLVLAPHADDEVLGMGASIARYAKEGRRVVIAVLTGHGDKKHPFWHESKWKTVREECTLAATVMGVNDVIFRELPAACLDHTPSWEVNQCIAEVISTVKPTEIYVPFEFDLHKDHAAVAYGAYVACRPYLNSALGIKRILAYETLSETHLAPSYMAPTFQPNVFIDVTDTLEKKFEAMRAYKSQLQEDGLPRSIASLRALATLRGAHIGSRAAEAFVLLGEYIR